MAVLLGVADALRQTPPTVGVDLLFVDGEDYGELRGLDRDVLLGSRYYAANPAPGPQPLYAVLFDMVGDSDLQIYQEGNSLTGAPEVVELVWNAAKTRDTRRSSSPPRGRPSPTTTCRCSRPASAPSTWWTSTTEQHASGTPRTTRSTR